MNYIVRDNGNRFQVIGLKGVLKIDNKSGCYVANLGVDDRDKGYIGYNEAVNYLLPKEYKKWQKKRNLLL
jgi:hypothetical protein